VLPIKANFVLGRLPNLWLHHEIEKKRKRNKFREIVGSDVVSCKTIPSNIFFFFGGGQIFVTWLQRSLNYFGELWFLVEIRLIKKENWNISP
jgi:hypothetical protein